MKTDEHKKFNNLKRYWEVMLEVEQHLSKQHGNYPLTYAEYR